MKVSLTGFKVREWKVQQLVSFRGKPKIKVLGKTSFYGLDLHSSNASRMQKMLSRQ